MAITRAQAHSAGRSQTACESAFEVWSSLLDYTCRYNTDKTRAFDQLLLTLRAIHSDENHLHQRAILQVDTRLPPGITPEQWYAQLHLLAGDAEITRQSYAVPAWTCEKNTPVVRAFLAAIRAQGGNPAFVYKTGTADLNTVAPIWRCPALVYGPGDSALDHTMEECLSLEEYQMTINILSNAMSRLTSN